MLTAFGWAGSLLLALCALPQMIHTIRTGDASGLSWLFLLMWGVGEILTLIYVIFDGNYPLSQLNYPLICNYTLNCVIITVLIYYKTRS